ncbi:hypothetical protein PCANC_06572 [Puccinia coronata f. sp. avenae]|uniref:Uncharacterized protein n=1 Tax=Puccinia coronata f. sp. avenae TaxID=200324 RepID=A0A2N5VA47_9BASI|nr:hypothetical protein PCANC_06572 [Puccinia coronata f. sp. avenae]
MEKLQKELSDLEAKVEAGFLQINRWQEIDRHETKKLQDRLSQKVDQAVFEQLSEAQAESSNQLDEYIVQRSLAKHEASAQAIQEDLAKKFRLLQADIDALKSNTSQLVPSESPGQIVQTRQSQQELEKLIGAKSDEITKTLQGNLEAIEQKLCATECRMDIFKSEEYPRDVELVKSGVNKLVNDLKNILGPGRSQTFSDELDTIFGRNDILASEINSVKLSVGQLLQEFSVIKDNQSEKRLHDIVKNNAEGHFQQLKLLQEDIETAKSNFMSQIENNTYFSNSIDNAVKSAVDKVKEEAFSNQARDQILRLGTQSQWDEIDQKLGEMTRNTSINAANFSSLAEEIKTNQARDEILRLGTQSKWDKLVPKLEEMERNASINADNFNRLAEEIKAINLMLIQNQRETATLREQVTNSTFNKDAFDKDAAEFKKEIDLIRSQITSKLEIELQALKHDLKATLLEGSGTTNFHLDSSLQEPPVTNSHCQAPKDDLRNVVSIGSSDNETESRSRLEKGKNKQVQITSNSPTSRQNRHPNANKAASKSSRYQRSIASDDDEPELFSQSQKNRENFVHFGSTGRSISNRSANPSHPSTSRNPYSQSSERNSHPYRRFPRKHSSSPTHRSEAPLYRKGKYANSGNGRKSAEGIRPSSIRKDRSEMNARDKDEDESLSNVIQHHTRILTSTRRDKDDILPLATEPELENLPVIQKELNELSLPVNSPYLLTKDQVNLNILDDADIRIGFARFCEQRARQYGLPFVGLASEDTPKGREWNERTKLFLLDTLSHAITWGEYPQFNLGTNDPDLARLEKLMRSHLMYQLELIERFMRNSQYLEAARKNDRTSSRRMRLSQRRLQTCREVPELTVYTKVFEDERLCSSDESMDDSMDEDKVRHTPLWRSQLARALVNRVDMAYKQLRRTEYPKKTGRKPSKRLQPRDPIISNESCWPIGLPEDCYDPTWFQRLEPQQKISLNTQQPLLGELINMAE